MRKTETRHNGTSDTKEARMEAAQFFVKGDRVCNRANGKMGLFTGINEGEALPEVWVAFDSDTDSRIPISCNPLDLELAQKDCPEHKVLRQYLAQRLSPRNAGMERSHNYTQRQARAINAHDRKGGWCYLSAHRS